MSYGIRTASGNVYYVGDSDATYYDANDNHDGTNPIYPKATIQAGLDACTNDRGDMVVLLADNYELTESLTITVDRVRLISWDYLTRRIRAQRCDSERDGRLHAVHHQR